MNVWQHKCCSKLFDENYLLEELLKHQWEEFVELKKIITEIYLKKGNFTTVLDIGIGNNRIVKHLSRNPEMWNMIKFYEGADNAETFVNLSRNTDKDLNFKG